MIGAAQLQLAAASAGWEMPAEDPAPSLEEEAATMAGSFRAFHPAAFKVVEPGIDLVDEWYLHAVIDHMEAWGRGVKHGGIKDLIINFRPRMLKTITCSVGFQAWMATWWPTAKMFWATYHQTRQKAITNKTRDLVKSKWYQDRWPRPLAPAQDEASRFALLAGAQFYSAVYGTGATGDGGDRLGLDDPQSGADQRSQAELDNDEEWFYNTWQRRRDNEHTSGMAIITQRLGEGEDLCERLVYNEPNRFERLVLQTRKTTVQVIQFRKGEEAITLPLVDTQLSRDGRFVDPREPGELLSSRVNPAELDTLERVKPLVYAAQEQQTPLRGTREGAKVHAFKRTEHCKSFAARMGCADLRSAVDKALREGWRVTTGWDHGIDARREICHVLLWHMTLQEMWVVATYANTARTTPIDDARAVRRVLDGLGIPIRAVIESLGDVGGLGKGAAELNAPSINAALSTAREADGSPILGFPIGTARKGPGSVEKGTEVLNIAFAGGALYVDYACSVLAAALEGWVGGEALKDFIDAIRYGACYRLASWQVRSGSQ